jgi:hypothetical protein
LTETDVVYVAVALPWPAEAGIVEKVASIVGKDPFGTRVLLNSKIPRILGYYGSLQAAEAVAERLRLLGLVAVVCGQAELRPPYPARFRAHTLKLKEGEITFWDKRGQSRVVDAKSVLLILRGTARTEVETGTTKTKMKLNVAATVLTGGIPVVHKVVERTGGGSLKMEDFVRLYDWTSAEPVLEVFQNDFDYSSLEKKKGFSSQENINIIVTELRSTFPAAVFDGRLTAHFKADVPFASPEEEIEINSKLIYLCHRAGKSPAT